MENPLTPLPGEDEKIIPLLTCTSLLVFQDLILYWKNKVRQQSLADALERKKNLGNRRGRLTYLNSCLNVFPTGFFQYGLRRKLS